jgi:hypothetical protein
MQSYKSLLASFYVLTLIQAACVIGTFKFAPSPHLHRRSPASPSVNSLHHTHRSREPSYFTKQLAHFDLMQSESASAYGTLLPADMPITKKTGKSPRTGRTARNQRANLCSGFAPPIRPNRVRDTFSWCIMNTILLLILILLLIGALPAWPYSRGWGYYPSGGLGLILVIVIALVLLGTI